MSDVFISYARSTERQARATAGALRALGYSVWVDEDLPSHRAYADVIAEQLVAARAVVVIWSEDAVKSQWVRSEANRAREAEKLVQLAVDSARLPMPFDQIQCVRLDGWSGVGEHPLWPRVLASIVLLVGGSAAPKTTQPSTSRGERRHLTVLDCALTNATELAARRDPEQWREIAISFQRAATQAVNRLSGHVAKARVDGVVAYFGYPEAQEDAAERAVRAGLAIVEATTALNEQFAAEHKVKLSVQVGVHAGTVVVAQGDGADVDMFGDAPRVASTVQALAAPDTVLMTAGVHDLVGGLFVVEDLGAQPHGDAKDAIGLYRAIRPGLARGRNHGFTVREVTPFVGREEELRLLHSRWERVRDGEGQLVLVIGEPGIGKSRLAEEFRARIKNEPHLWIECAGAPLFANTPFHAVTQMLDQDLGWRGDEGPQERLVRLEQALAPSPMKLDETVPLIAGMLNLPIPSTYPPLNLAPDQARQRLLAALVGWVFTASTDQPLVIMMEDMHWVDPSTMELIHTLVEQGATAPLLLLCTARPEFRPVWAVRGHHAQITLGRLNNNQTRELVTGVTSRAGLAEEVIESVITRTDGVPLFAEELTRLMMESDGHSGAREIPANLLDSLAARLDRLGRAKDVAQLGAVLGREFSYELLRAVSPAPEAELQADLAKLTEADVIHARGLPPDASYRFKHALTQDAAYEALLKSRRRELHALVARTIAERFGPLAETQPEVLARHWTQAGEAIPAIAAWKSAGDTAYGRRAFKEAEEGYRQALAMLDTQSETPDRDARELELRSALNRVLQLTRGYAAPETVEAAGRARTLAEKGGTISQLVREEARVWRAIITSGDYAAASALADHILDLAKGEVHNPGRLIFAHNAQVQSRFYTGDLAGVEEHFALLSPLIEDVGLRQAPGNNNVSIGVASVAAWAMGRAKTARERLARALVFAEASNNPYDLAMMLHFQDIILTLERDAAAAEASSARLLSLAEENGFSYAVDLAKGSLGWALAQKGEIAEGVNLMRQASAGLAASGARVGQTLGLIRFAEAEVSDGAFDKALNTIEDALTVNPQERVFRSSALRLRGDVQLALGEADLADADFREAITLARDMGARAWEFRAATSLARLQQVRGDGAAARDLLAPIRDAFSEEPCAADLKDAEGLLGVPER